jgi:hypothetical protein
MLPFLAVLVLSGTVPERCYQMVGNYIIPNNKCVVALNGAVITAKTKLSKNANIMVVASPE